MALPQAGVQLIAEGAGEFLSTMEKGARGVTDFGAAAEKAGGGVSSFGQIAIGALREVGAMAVSVAASAGKALVGFMGDSISVAGDFEAGMNKFSAAAGDSLEAAGLKAAEFRDLFLDIGARLPVSTSEVQEAATTLIKGGIDPLILKMGGLESSIQFAAAAGMDLNSAAELSIKQLGTFVPITATAAEQVAFLATSQDLLVKAAGASTLDVDKLGAAMLAAGGQARAAGVDYQDFVTVMGLISPSFSSAETAGTAYKNFLARLIPATKPAKEAMENIGLVAADGKSKFFDLTGSYIGNAAAAELLQTALAPLTDAQRLSTLQTIFGNDAMGAAQALAAGGAEAYEAFAAKMAAANGVQAQATTVQQGYNIAMDNFKGSVESLQITIGSLLLPLLTTLFNTVLAPAVNTLTTLTNAITGNQAAFASLSPTLQGVVLGIQMLPAILTAVIASLSGVAAGVMGFVAALAPVNTAVSSTFGQLGGIVTSAIGAIMAGVAQAAPAFTPMIAAWSGAVASVQTTLGQLGGIVSSVLSQVQGFIDTYGAQAVATFATTWASVSTTVAGLVSGLMSIIQPILTEIQTFINAHGAEIQAFFAQTWSTIGEIVQTAMAIINATVVPALQAIGSFIASHGTEIQQILSNSWNGISTLISTVLNTIAGLFKTVLQVIQGDWQGAWATLQSTSASFVSGIVTAIQSGLANIPAIFTLIFGDALAAVQGYIAPFVSIGSDIVHGIADGVRSAAQSLVNAAISVVKDAISAAKSAISSNSPSRLTNIEIGQPFTQGIAVGVLAAKPAVTRAVNDIATHMTAETRKGAVDGGGSFGKSGGGARDIGRDFVAGISEGLSKAVSGGGLKVGADQVASGMLGAVKKPLAINSPSDEAAKQIGNPFVRGIIEGVLKAAPDLFKTLAKTAKDMLAVFDNLGEQIGKAIQGALTARADMFRGASDAWSSVLNAADPSEALGVAQEIADLQQQERDAHADMNEADREAAKERGAIMARAYDDESKRAADLMEVVEKNLAARSAFGQQMASIQRELTAAQERQRYADDALLAKRRLGEQAQAALRALGGEAAGIVDPAKRAAFLRMREAQIKELLDAQMAFEDARTALFAPGGDAYAEGNALAAADLRMAMVKQAQEAERAAFEAGLLTTADESGVAIGEGITKAVLANLGTIGTQFATVLAQALGGIRIEPRALGGPVSSGQPYLVGERGPELFLPQRSGRIQPLARPAQMARMAAAGNTYGGNTYNLNVATQQSVGSIRAEFGLMQVLAGA